MIKSVFFNINDISNFESQFDFSLYDFFLFPKILFFYNLILQLNFNSPIGNYKDLSSLRLFEISTLNEKFKIIIFSSLIFIYIYISFPFHLLRYQILLSIFIFLWIFSSEYSILWLKCCDLFYYFLLALNLSSYCFLKCSFKYFLSLNNPMFLLLILICDYLFKLNNS